MRLYYVDHKWCSCSKYNFGKFIFPASGLLYEVKVESEQPSPDYEEAEVSASGFIQEELECNGGGDEDKCF